MKFFSKMTALTVMGIVMIWGTQGMGQSITIKGLKHNM